MKSERLKLRLERRGRRVRALCSADGREWFTLGDVEFTVSDLVEAGVPAVGMIDRSFYHGAYPNGTAIRFDDIQIWQ